MTNKFPAQPVGLEKTTPRSARLPPKKEVYITVPDESLISIGEKSEVEAPAVLLQVA